MLTVALLEVDLQPHQVWLQEHCYPLYTLVQSGIKRRLWIGILLAEDEGETGTAVKSSSVSTVDLRMFTTDIRNNKIFTSL